MSDPIELRTEEPRRNKVHTWKLYWLHSSDPDASYSADEATLAKAGFVSASRLHARLMVAHGDIARELESQRERKDVYPLSVSYVNGKVCAYEHALWKLRELLTTYSTEELCKDPSVSAAASAATSCAAPATATPLGTGASEKEPASPTGVAAATESESAPSSTAGGPLATEEVTHEQARHDLGVLNRPEYHTRRLFRYVDQQQVAAAEHAALFAFFSWCYTELSYPTRELRAACEEQQQLVARALGRLEHYFPGLVAEDDPATFWCPACQRQRPNDEGHGDDFPDLCNACAVPAFQMIEGLPDQATGDWANAAARFVCEGPDRLTEEQVRAMVEPTVMPKVGDRVRDRKVPRRRGVVKALLRHAQVRVMLDGEAGSMYTWPLALCEPDGQCPECGSVLPGVRQPVAPGLECADVWHTVRVTPQEEP